jgi:hypothetical protein
MPLPSPADASTVQRTSSSSRLVASSRQNHDNPCTCIPNKQSIHNFEGIEVTNQDAHDWREE